MEQPDLMGLGTVFAMIAFASVCIWAYSGKRREQFEEAAQLPFADDRPMAGNEDGNEHE